MRNLEPDQLNAAGVKLDRAKQASEHLKRFDRSQIDHIVRAVAESARLNGERFARQAVSECGFGVVQDKVVKNEAFSSGFLTEYGDMDFVGHRVDAATGMLEIPRPAGVIFALTPSTSPVAALYFKVLSALLTRNAIVISPHPAVVRTCVEAAEVLRRAAIEAGAPEGAIEILAEPSVPLVEAVMADDRINLILATGGLGVVRAAYRSGTPAIGVGPGNPPLIVDETADLERAAQHIIQSKSFDNSVLCTAESVLFAVDAVADDLLRHLVRHGAHVCSETETSKLRSYMYPSGKLNTDVVGRTATEIAKAAGIRSNSSIRLLVAPIKSVVDEESFTHEKLSPVLAMHRVPTFADAVHASVDLVSIVGRGHSAVVHSQDPQRVLDMAVALEVHRITVNAPGSLGNAGIGTALPKTMSVGTGYIGGSSSGDNLTPSHLVQWSRVSYATEAGTSVPDFSRLTPSSLGVATAQVLQHEGLDVSRDDLRRLIVEELRGLIGESVG